MEHKGMLTKPRVLLGSDHAGYGMRMSLYALLQSEGYELSMFGGPAADPVDYPDVVHELLDQFKPETDRAILLCGSGNGVCITANHRQGIRAALCWTPELASLARSHNDAQVLCLPARFITIETAVDMVRTFLTTDFEGGRHENRIHKIERP
jgi:ribose 5-phosphate isomerase B